MSHIGNKIKAGFFATPERQGNYLRSLLRFTGDVAVLDPTCGAGDILRQIATQTDNSEFGVRTYGVELDKRRAGLAKENLDVVVQAPIESMIISNDSFGLVFLNPPYDHTMLGYGDEKTERKEYTELVRGFRYLKEGGVMVYIIPSYRYADLKIAKFLSTHFEQITVTRFTDEDYPDFRQCIFIGKKLGHDNKVFNEELYAFLQQMGDEDFVMKRVSPLNHLISRTEWVIPTLNPNIRTFTSRIEDKSEFGVLLRDNKGLHALKERTRPRQLILGGEPITNLQQGLMALLLASGAVNGVLGEGDTLHVVQGMEVVSKSITEENTEDTLVTKSRTKREVVIKYITPQGVINKLG